MNNFNNLNFNKSGGVGDGENPDGVESSEKSESLVNTENTANAEIGEAAEDSESFENSEKLKKSERIQKKDKVDKKKVFMLLFFISPALALIGAVFLYRAMIFSYDASIGHFVYGSSSAAVSCVIFIIGALLSIFSFFMCGKDFSFSKGKRRSLSFAEVFFSMLAACFSVLYGVLSLSEDIPTGREIFFVLRTIFAFIAAVYFVSLVTGMPSSAPSTGFFAAGASLECAFMLLLVYFTYDNCAMNSPVKTYELLMLVSFMLFYAAEAGRSIERPGTDRKYAFAAVFAVCCGGQVALARLICILAQSEGFSFSLVSCLFRVALWLQILVSFYGNIKSSKRLKRSASAKAGDLDGYEHDYDREDEHGGEDTDIAL